MQSFKKEFLEDICVYTELVTGVYNNVSVIEDTDGLLLIDTFKTRELMNQLLLDLEATYHKKIKLLIITHWHIDHSIGAFFLSPVNIISTQYSFDRIMDFMTNHLERMIKNRIVEQGITATLPNITFKEKHIVQLSNKRCVELFHLPGHSFDGLVAKYENILFAGDNLVGEEVEVFLPPVIPPDAEFSQAEHLFDAIRKIQNFDTDYIVGGHGFLMQKQSLIDCNCKRLNTLLIMPETQ